MASRRCFYDRLQSEIARSKRFGKPFTLIYIDIDDFKNINDKYGHAEGDHALSMVAASLKSTTRETDTVGRIGGDEFLILLPECNRQGAEIIVNKIQSTIELESVKSKYQRITLSMGVLTTVSPNENQEDIVNSADKLMFQVKNGGKNGVSFSILE